jgi:hypothetical protein
MERFFDGDRSVKIQKYKKKENWRKEKEEIFNQVELPVVLVCSPSIRNTLELLLSCDPPSGEPTPMGTSPTTFTYPTTPRDPQEKAVRNPPTFNTAQWTHSGSFK